MLHYVSDEECRFTKVMLHKRWTMSNILKKLIAITLTASFALGIAACHKKGDNPLYEDMVMVKDGTGGEMLVPLYDELPAAEFNPEDFESDEDKILYKGSEREVMYGIDVSEHQAEIDWEAVRDSGVDFAMIRAGYRGYSEGQLHEDSFFKQNIEGAQKYGIPVGVYFFSQAVEPKEAREEAKLLLDIIDGYDIDLPIFYDWENIGYMTDARTDDLDSETLTDCCLEFCEKIADEGYETGVYFYRSLGYLQYQLSRLKDLYFWVGAPGDYPDFYYDHMIWQYSYTGQVDGIEKDTDLNILFVPEIDEKDEKEE